jgi:hypothetical protein
MKGLFDCGMFKTWEVTAMLRPDIQIMSEDHATTAPWRLLACGIVLSAFAGLLVAGRLSGPAMAQASVYQTHCAARHSAAIAWIDQLASEPSASELILAERALVALRARNACMHGQITRALDLYETILSDARNAQK